MTLPPGFVTIADLEAEAEHLAAARKAIARIDQAECVDRGGHCYDLTRESPDLLPGPCKHCGVRPGRGPAV